MLKDSFVIMKLKDQLQNRLKDKIDCSLLDRLPSGYSRTGDIAIFHHIDEELQDYKELIGDTIIQLDPQVNVVIEQKTTETIHRKPQIIHLAGEKRYVTHHKEFNTVFHLDVSEITFSPGNKGERNHLIRIVKDNEKICDMFACIGNLSLPIVVNNPTVTAHGIEINETAFKFLKKNIKANNVEERYIPIHGDNRRITPSNFASRVLMGYFECDSHQIRKAIEALKDEGWIHLHSIVVRNEEFNVKEILDSIQREIKFDYRIHEVRKIKKFSPRMNHLCFDIWISKS